MAIDIECIAGFATITPDPAASAALYRDTLGLSFKSQGDYLYMDRFPGTNHFGMWPLAEAALACFAQREWPESVPVPTSTIEFELADVAAVEAAVAQMKAGGQVFIHEARTEPWGQTLARFMSPENILVGLSYAPWLHETKTSPDTP